MPIVRDGRVVGEVHRHDNRLTMAVLDALDRRAVARPPAPAVEGGILPPGETGEMSRQY